MKQSNKFLSDYVYLAEASYADFSKGYDTDAVILALTADKDKGGQEAPESFAKLVTKNYTVKAHWEDRTEESSFSGTLFKGTGKDDGNTDYVLALKGTKEVVDDLIITDGGEIVHDGLAHHQIVRLTR